MPIPTKFLLSLQCTARADAVHCKGGRSALQEGLQCTASEMGKTDTEIASPILDRRKGREKGLHMEHCSPTGNAC